MTTTHPAPVLRRWPTALGLAAAAAAGGELLTAGVAAAGGQAVVLAVPVLVYAVAATTRRPTLAWPAVGAATVIVVVASVLEVDPVPALAAVALAVLVGGLVGRRRVPVVQVAGALGFGAVALVGLVLVPTAGAVVVGLGLLGHAAWDVVHHRRGVVVTRSLAEFCAVLDTVLGLALLAVALP